MQCFSQKYGIAVTCARELVNVPYDLSDIRKNFLKLSEIFKKWSKRPWKSRPLPDRLVKKISYWKEREREKIPARLHKWNVEAGITIVSRRFSLVLRGKFVREKLGLAVHLFPSFRHSESWSKNSRLIQSTVNTQQAIWEIIEKKTHVSPLTFFSRRQVQTKKNLALYMLIAFQSVAFEIRRHPCPFSSHSTYTWDCRVACKAKLHVHEN